MIEINGTAFERVPDIRYLHTYEKAAEKIAAGEWNEAATYREFVKKDLWFVVFFVLKVSIANCKFWVDACRDVQKGPRSHTLDVWAREHGKSTIITIAEVIQRILSNPEERIAIFSYAKSPALTFLRQVKFVFEQSQFLKDIFPDVLYQNPTTEAFKWGEESGLYLQRKGFYKEPTLSAYGLVEGMPTGMHFTGRVYDDIMTQDLINTPEIMQKVKEQFDMSQNLGTVDGWMRLIGTPYHHEDVIAYLRGKSDANGTPIYSLRLKPATVDGLANSPSVYLPESRLAELRTNKQMFYSQQLLDPTPQGEESLNSEFLKYTKYEELPKRLYKFMVIDPAGVRKDRVGDSWSILVVGVEPYLDAIGASNLFVLDGVIDVLAHDEAMDEIVRLYLRNKPIRRVGVEKVASSTWEIHVANALRVKGKVNVTLENGSLVNVRPAGRKKEWKILENLTWPLNNGKIHFASSCPTSVFERMKLEMRKFPFWHDDGLDTLAYAYDMLKEFRFSLRDLSEAEERPLTLWDRIAGKKEADIAGWMVQ